MTPAEAARAVASDYDLIGTQDADWMATAWRRFAEKLDPRPCAEVNPEYCVDHHLHERGWYS
jgi:hypothetical protein